jgi:hypothetical protein
MKRVAITRPAFVPEVANPEAPVTVDLPKPLGDRAVMEGPAIGIGLADLLP